MGTAFAVTCSIAMEPSLIHGASGEISATARSFLSADSSRMIHRQVWWCEVTALFVNA